MSDIADEHFRLYGIEITLLANRRKRMHSTPSNHLSIA